MNRLMFGLIAFSFLLAASKANSQVASAKIEIPLVGSKCNDRVKSVDSVYGILRLPEKTSAPLSVVVILHSNAGFVGVGEFYSKALNEAGIGTLEVDSYSPRDVRAGNEKTAPVLCDRLQDAWGALALLAKDTRIDPSRIGIAGFSSGGAVSIMTAMGIRPRRLARQNSQLPQDLVYAAHFALYPACANIMDDQLRIRSWINPGKPQNWGSTGKPLHIVSGTKDDYEYDPKIDCLRMSKEFPDIADQLSLRMVEGATHAFDWPNPPPPTYSPFAKAQTGGIVNMRYSQKEAESARVEMVQFFSEKLK